jgi:hypothetical protein
MVLGRTALLIHVRRLAQLTQWTALVAFLLFFSNSLQAQPPDQTPTTTPNKKPPGPVQVFLLSNFTSLSTFRGAETWPIPSLLVLPGVSFYERWFLRRGLLYKFFPRSYPWELNASVEIFDDTRPLLPLAYHSPDHRNLRPAVWEFRLEGKYRFGFRNLFSVGSKLAQALTEYKGLYSEIRLEAPIFIFTTASITSSYAAPTTNRYLYGPEGLGGFGYGELSLNSIMPYLGIPGISFAQLKYSWLWQEANRSADYIRDRHEILRLQWTWIWKLNEEDQSSL